MNTKFKIVDVSDRPVIQPRLFTLPLSSNVPRYWANNDAYATHLLNAFSCIFPGGERFFVRSVLRFQPQVVDPRLKREVRQFCGQESVHGQQHEAYNQWAKCFGYPLDEMTEKFEATLIRNSSMHSDIFCLALTAALEHFTAVMGNALLTSDELLESFHPEVRPLWIWHAIEEIEHKAVAYEVLMQIDGRYGLRVGAMILAILGLVTSTMILMSRLLWKDRQIFNLRSFIRWMSLMYRTGFMTSVISGIAEYFRPGFHPWQTDDRTLLERYMPKVLGYVREQRAPAKEISA